MKHRYVFITLLLVISTSIYSKNINQNKTNVKTFCNKSKQCSNKKINKKDKITIIQDGNNNIVINKGKMENTVIIQKTNNNSHTTQVLNKVINGN